MSVQLPARRVYEGLLVLPAVLNRRWRANLLVDTGASYSALTESYLGAHPSLRIEPTNQSWFAGTAGRTGGVEMPSFRIHRLRVELILRENFEFVRMQLPPNLEIDGVLGVNFLRDFRVTFDFIDGWIELAER